MWYYHAYTRTVYPGHRLSSYVTFKLTREALLVVTRPPMTVANHPHTQTDSFDSFNSLFCFFRKSRLALGGFILEPCVPSICREISGKRESYHVFHTPEGVHMGYVCSQCFALGAPTQHVHKLLRVPLPGQINLTDACIFIDHRPPP